MANELMIHFTSDQNNHAACTYMSQLLVTYQQHDIQHCDVIVAIGGDGFMLHTLHLSMLYNKPVFGINFGSVGFLMNKHNSDNLFARITGANSVTINALKLNACTADGEHKSYYALNEVSLLRQSHQAIKLRVTIDDKEKLHNLVCDGVMVATPAGSTAYNLSASGPILPITSNLIALTPISPFRPRRWRGALLPNYVSVNFEVSEADKRPVSVSADYQELRNVTVVDIVRAKHKQATLLFDQDQPLSDRIIQEQFES